MSLGQLVQICVMTVAEASFELMEARGSGVMVSRAHVVD